MARLIVASRERREWWPLAIAAAVGAWALTRVAASGLDVALHDGFLLAIAVTAARVSGERRQAVPRWVWPALAAPALLVAFGAVHVDPHQTDDPRHYEAQVTEDLRDGNVDRARARLTRVEEFAASDRRLRLCRARTELAAGGLRDAALHLAQALAPLTEERRQVLPLPEQRAWRPLLADVRDAVSADGDPAAVLAFAHALAAAGEAEGAVELLRRRIAPVPPPEGVDPTLAADALAALLGDVTLAEAMAQWPGDQVWGAAAAMGAEVASMPEGASADPSGIVLAAVYGYDAVTWVAVSAAGATSGRLRLSGAPATSVAEIPRSVGWRVQLGEGRETDRRFLLVAEPGAETLATLRMRVDRVAVTGGGDAVVGRLPVGWCMLVLPPHGAYGTAGLDIDARPAGLEDGI